jgi:hypothetical protein
MTVKVLYISLFCLTAYLTTFRTTRENVVGSEISQSDSAWVRLPDTIFISTERYQKFNVTMHLYKPVAYLQRKFEIALTNNLDQDIELIGCKWGSYVGLVDVKGKLASGETRYFNLINSLGEENFDQIDKSYTSGKQMTILYKRPDKEQRQSLPVTFRIKLEVHN